MELSYFFQTSKLVECNEGNIFVGLVKDDLGKIINFLKLLCYT